MGNQRGDLIACCDVRATNYNSDATTCCSDCCTYPSGGPTNEDVSPTALYPSVSKPTTAGDWKRYKVIYQNSGSCSIAGGLKYTTSTSQNALVWAKPVSGGYMHIHLPKGCAIVVASDRLALQNGIINGNGTNSTQFQTAGFDLDKYLPYIIGTVILIIAWRMGLLKKLMPK